MSHYIEGTGNILCDLDLVVNVKGQIMCFLVHASPLKPLDVPTSHFTGA